MDPDPDQAKQRFLDQLGRTGMAEGIFDAIDSLILPFRRSTKQRMAGLRILDQMLRQHSDMEIVKSVP